MQSMVFFLMEVFTNGLRFFFNLRLQGMIIELYYT